MAWGDGVTGVVRNLIYKKRTQAWEGSLAMLLVCIPVGTLIGLAGVIAATPATVVERLEGFDDNISIPLVSLAILLPAYVFKVNLPL